MWASIQAYWIDPTRTTSYPHPRLCRESAALYGKQKKISLPMLLSITTARLTMIWGWWSAHLNQLEPLLPKADGRIRTCVILLVKSTMLCERGKLLFTLSMYRAQLYLRPLSMKSETVYSSMTMIPSK